MESTRGRCRNDVDILRVLLSGQSMNSLEEQRFVSIWLKNSESEGQKPGAKQGDLEKITHLNKSF